MTDDRHAIHGTLSPYGHTTLARCIHHHEPIGRYLDDARGFAADLKAKGIIGDTEPEPGTAPWFDHVREELAAEGHRIGAADWLWTEGE